MSELANEMERLLRKMAARKMEQVVEDAADEYILDTVAVRIRNLVQGPFFAQIAAERLASLADEGTFRENLIRAVESAMGEKVERILADHVRNVVSSDLFQNYVKHHIIQKVDEILRLPELKSRIEEFVKSLLDEATRRVFQQAFTPRDESPPISRAVGSPSEDSPTAAHLDGVQATPSR